MARRYVFADEAGNFDFSPRGSRYFILTTVTLSHCMVGDALTDLRRELAWEGLDFQGQFRATEEAQAIRNRVFAILAAYDFRIDATIVEKTKIDPHRREEAAFYRLTWWLHFKHVAPQIVNPWDDLLVVGASLGTERKRQLFRQGMDDVVAQVVPEANHRTAFWSAAAEPCLQVADYCCWAIQRKWERNDLRSYDLISNKIRSEFDVFRANSSRSR